MVQPTRMVCCACAAPMPPSAHAATTLTINRFEFSRVMHPSPDDGQRPAVVSQKLAQAFHASNARASNPALYASAFSAALPAYFAWPPSCCSIRNSWLYLAVRSERASEPVLIWPQLVATARSAMVESSVSPERCDITAV